MLPGSPGASPGGQPHPGPNPTKGLKGWFHLRPSWPQSQILRDRGQGMEEGLGPPSETPEAGF